MIRDNREYRSMPLLADSEIDYNVEGYASTFDEYLLFTDGEEEFWERIDRNAFDHTDMTDVVCMIDHDGRVYARTRNGSINLSVDDHGLKCRIDLGRSTSARMLKEDIDCGNYDRMSFAFTVKEDEITHDREEKKYYRVIKSVGKLFDISPVSFPANPNTSIGRSARSAFDGFIEAEKALELEREEHRKKLEEAKKKYFETGGQE